MTASNAISSRTAHQSAPPRNADSSSSTGERFALSAGAPSLDPRIHAFRADVADIALAGQVITSFYARPLVRACGMRSAFLYETASAEGDPVSELLPGECFAVIEYSGGWAWGFSMGDRRVGYVEAIQLTEPGEATHIVCEPSAPIHPGGSIDSPILCRVPMGTRLHGVENGPCLHTESGCVPMCHLRRVGECEEDPVTVAERLVGAPFAKGGRTFRGLDGPALVQLAFGLCGPGIPREIDQQRAMGEAVGDDEPLRRGDIVFADDVVAIAVDGERVVHASAAAGVVTVEAVTALGAVAARRRMRR